jgi:hypothetical protein
MTRTTSSRAFAWTARALITMAGCVARSTGFSTGVAKKELSIADLVVEKAAELGRGTPGVAVGQGPWQLRLEEILQITTRGDMGGRGKPLRR